LNGYSYPELVEGRARWNPATRLWNRQCARNAAAAWLPGKGANLQQGPSTPPLEQAMRSQRSCRLTSRQRC